MTFQVPLKYADLTLGQLMTLQTEEDKFKRVASCANITIEELRNAPMNEVIEADKHLKRIADEETGRHLKVIELNGQQYGFIPNWQEFSLGEWIDIEEYSADFWNNADKIMSILYRPLLRQSGDAHTIEKYTAKEDSEAFKQIPADLFGGCILFFFEFKERTTAHYSILFNGNGAEPDPFSVKWGWYPCLYTLAKEDLQQMDAITEKSVGSIFTHLAYLKDLHFKLKNDNVQ